MLTLCYTETVPLFMMPMLQSLSLRAHSLHTPPAGHDHLRWSLGPLNSIDSIHLVDLSPALPSAPFDLCHSPLNVTGPGAHGSGSSGSSGSSDDSDADSKHSLRAEFALLSPTHASQEERQIGGSIWNPCGGGDEGGVCSSNQLSRTCAVGKHRLFA